MNQMQHEENDASLSVGNKETKKKRIPNIIRFSSVSLFKFHSHNEAGTHETRPKIGKYQSS